MKSTNYFENEVLWERASPAKSTNEQAFRQGDNLAEY